VFGLVWRPRVCLAHPVPGDGRSSGGSPEPERIEQPRLASLCSAPVPAQRDRSRRSGAALLHDCEDPPRSSVMLLGCGSVIASVTHFMTGFVPF
jgi:hypothetical protein